jgi:putative FmdB family regulatory protein
MPTYRYRCEQCGDELEVWQSFSEEPLSAHDDGCGGHLVRVLTPAGIVFKGPGFHKTDSRSGNGKRGGSDKESSGKEKESSSDSSGSSDSKPKSDTKSDSSSSSNDTKASSPSGSSGSGSSTA